MEKEFFKALSMVKSRNKIIYDKDKCKFFDIESESKNTPESSGKKNDGSKKPFYMKDLEREIILKK